LLAAAPSINQGAWGRYVLAARQRPTDWLWGAALTLILPIAVINVGAKVIAKAFAPETVGRSSSG